MDSPESNDAARNRFLVIGLLRLGGVVMVLAGLLMIAGRVGGGTVVGYALLALGLLDVFALPLWLARKWRSPRE